MINWEVVSLCLQVMGDHVSCLSNKADKAWDYRIRFEAEAVKSLDELLPLIDKCLSELRQELESKSLTSAEAQKK